MRPSPLLSAAAATALLAALAGPALASTPATPAVPAKGVGSSSLTLLGLSTGGHTLSAGTLELLSEALQAQRVAKVVLTPLTADGAPIGRQTVTPGSSPGSTPSARSSSLVPALAGVISVSSPVVSATASDGANGPSSSAGATSLGGLSVLGLPLTLAGSLEAGSGVTSAGAVGDKTVSVTDLALPSVADLLGALGLDLTALPYGVLEELVARLDLANGAVDAASKAVRDATAALRAQITAAQVQIDDASTAVVAKTAELAAAQSRLVAAERDLTARAGALAPLRTSLANAQTGLTAAHQPVVDATAALSTALAPSGLTRAGYQALSPLDPVRVLLAPVVDPLVVALDSVVATQQPLITAATAAVTTTTSDLARAQSLADVAGALVTTLTTTVATLTSELASLQAALDAALAALDGVLAGVRPLIDTLVGAITAVLDKTPLVSLDNLELLTRSSVTSAVAGGQTARIVGGELTGLKVLGTDVLDDVLGTTSVDVLTLTSSTLAQVNDAISGLTGTLSDVLSTVPGFPTLSLPAPAVELLRTQRLTGIRGGFGTASTAVHALSITLPAIALPSALALPGAASFTAFTPLPALPSLRAGLGLDTVTGLLTSAPVRIDLLTLADSARFAPGVAAAPGTAAPGAATPGAAAPGTATPNAAAPATADPGTVAPQLPRTGAGSALALLGTVLLGLAAAARRRAHAAL